MPKHAKSWEPSFSQALNENQNQLVGLVPGSDQRIRQVDKRDKRTRVTREVKGRGEITIGVGPYGNPR